MSMEDLRRAIAIIGKNPDLADFDGPKPDGLIAKAEEALGVRFPPTYREFLSTLGAGGFAGAEFYGVINPEFRPSVPDAVGCTLESRQRGWLPDNLVQIADDGAGDYYCLAISGSEAPVILFLPGAPLTQQHEVIAEDFGAFLFQQVTRYLGYARESTS